MKQPKQFYQRWWFWLFVIIFILAVIGNLSPENSDSTTSNSDNGNINPPASSRTYLIEISGTAGLEFTGNIGGGGNSRSIEGTIPATYTVEGWPAIAVIQKKQESGKLIVTMKKDNKILNAQETTAAYGVVTVNSG